MIKILLKPLGIILSVYVVAALDIASDLLHLTNFNLLDFLGKHSPQSYFLVVAVTILLYFVLVITELNRKKLNTKSSISINKSGQFIKTGNVKNSTIIQIKKDKED
jgi:hypothetical protein